MSTQTLLPYMLQHHILPPPPHKERVRNRIVRRIHPNAAQGWARLYDQIARSPGGRPPHEGLCRKESQHVFWAIDAVSQENILGMMVCTPIRVLGRRVGVVHDIIIAERYRYQGIAAQILDGVIAWSRQEAYANGIPGITLLQTAAPLRRTPLAIFLEKHGFQRTLDGGIPCYELDIAPNDAYRLAPAPR